MSSASYRAAVSRLRSQMRQAQSKLRAAERQIRYDLSHPEIVIVCTCGYDFKGRRAVNSLPTRCPACGAGIAYG
jgi:hypothetical protein